MIELYRDRDSSRIGHFQSILESEGIKTFIRNDTLAITEVSIPVFLPALCILDPADKDRAIELLRGFIESSEKAVTTELTCSACGEINPGNFEVCWNCGQEIQEGK
ncbi:DUF2007 domain-containing protein [Haloferula sp.]|uniref:putative signal transducing protein n=1 Tax=Haloferula sp. TaxID=2497595 RepID=UPI003C7099ED